MVFHIMHAYNHTHTHTHTHILSLSHTHIHSTTYVGFAISVDNNTTYGFNARNIRAVVVVVVAAVVQH
jgi:hypothetical protein